MSWISQMFFLATLSAPASTACSLLVSTLRGQGTTLPTSHCLDRVKSLNRLPGKGLACQGGQRIPTPNTRLLDMKVEDEVHIPISIHILDMPFAVRFPRLLGAKSDTQGINGSGIEGLGRQDSHRDLSFALRVDAVGKAARFVESIPS